MPTYTLHNAIIHKLLKEQHGRASVVERPSSLIITEPVEKLILDIQGLYTSRATKGYGRFESDEINYPFSSILRELFRDKKIGFVDASKAILSVLKKEADSAPLSTGGYVLMAYVAGENGVEWFLIAIINNVKSNAIDDETLEVIESFHIDLSDLRVVGRVNLTDWMKNDPESRYVGFIKHKGQVSDYFKNFLGCSELIKNTEETKKLVLALKDFTKNEELDQKARDKILRDAYDFCDEKHRKNEPISLKSFANAVYPDNPDKLLNTLVAENIEISDGFVPDNRSLRSLVKMKYDTKFWSINLDRSAFSQGFAQYDLEREELTLKKLPNAFKDELCQEIGDDAK